MTCKCIKALTLAAALAIGTCNATQALAQTPAVFPNVDIVGHCKREMSGVYPETVDNCITSVQSHASLAKQVWDKLPEEYREKAILCVKEKFGRDELQLEIPFKLRGCLGFEERLFQKGEPAQTPFPKWTHQDVATLCFDNYTNDMFCEAKSKAAEKVLWREWDQIKEEYKARCVNYMAEKAQGFMYVWAHYGDLNACIDDLATHDARLK